MRAGRQFGEDRLIAADKELDPENAVAAERIDDLARLEAGRLQRLARDPGRLPAFAIVTGFLPMADGSAQVRDCRDVPGSGLPNCIIKVRPKGSFSEVK